MEGQLASPLQVAVLVEACSRSQRRRRCFDSFVEWPLGAGAEMEINSFFLVDTPPTQSSDHAEKKAIPSKRRQLNFLPAVPVATAFRKMKMLEQKRAVVRNGVPSKKDWLLTSSRRGKGLKVKEEDRSKIVEWVRAHPDVVVSPFKQDE